MGLKQLFLLLAGLALISLASPGYAYDYKIYPGALCQPIAATDAVDLFKNVGVLVNTNSQQARNVTCPIIRDRVPHAGQPGERTPLDIGLWLRTRAVTRPVQCTFISINEIGTVVHFSTQVADPIDGVQALFWAVLPEQTAIDGTYTINCQLPPYTTLLRYTAGEDNVTDDGF